MIAKRQRREWFDLGRLVSKGQEERETQSIVQNPNEKHAPLTHGGLKCKTASICNSQEKSSFLRKQPDLS